MPPRIILATIGSLGDLHPFIAVGLALKACGASATLAVPDAYNAKVEAAGLEAVGIMPPFEQLNRSIGLTEQEAARKVMTDQDFMMREIMLATLPESVRRLDAATGGASVIVASTFALAAPIVVEKRGITLVPALLQPFALPLPSDAPVSRELRMLLPPPVGALGRAWNKAMLALVRRELRRRYNPAIDAVRAAHGLPPAKAAPLLDVPPDARLLLGLYPPLLAGDLREAPPGLRLTGFPVFDSDSGAPEELSSDLAGFLAKGEAPLVFTLGSFATYAPGDFYAASAAVARRLNRRAVLLTGDDEWHDGDVMACRYAPHGKLFPRAAAIIHHGGIGTTGQALAASRPQLIVPHMADQFDNAARIARLGGGKVVKASAYDTDTAVATLRSLLADSGIAAAALAASGTVTANRGAAAAAEAIMRVATV